MSDRVLFWVMFVAMAAQVVFWAWRVGNANEEIARLKRRPAAAVSSSPHPEPSCWQTTVRYTDNGQIERTEVCK